MNKAKLYIDYVEKYLNGSKEVHKIEFPELLEELKNYSPYKWRSDKAERIYYLCLERGKSKVARKIYSIYTNAPISDLVISLTMALEAQQNN